MSAPIDTLRLTLIPGISNPVSLRTTPGAACTIRPEGDTDPAHKLKIYADTEGFIHFHITPSVEHEQIVKLVVESVAEGKTTRYPIHLRSSRTATVEMPAPPQEKALLDRNAGKLRPALSIDDALRMTDSEALERGYPIRPNPEESPRVFHSWLSAVSVPTTVIQPQLITDPDITHGKSIQAGPAMSGNWSGFELDRERRITPVGRIGITPPYDWVAGEWVVPSVTGELKKTTYSSFWVGLDGDGVTDLVQAGTEQQCMNVTINLPFGSPLNYSVTSYYAWTEFLPQQPTEQRIANFAVRPGDRIFTEVWIGNAGSSPTLSGAFGVFFIENLTTGTSTTVYTPVGTTRVGGSEAVWIMERPTVGGVLSDLSNYGSAILSSATARQANSAAHQGYVAYQGLANKQISMINGANTLSIVTAIDANSMRFNWQRFN